jgi:hypothetical protein
MATNQKHPKLVVCSPHDLYFACEIEVQLFNLRQWGYTEGMVILVYEDNKEERERFKEYWIKLINRYTEVSFYFYENPNLKQLQKTYPQICRPWMLSEFWKQHPMMQTETFLYLDSDVLITKSIDWEPLMQGDTCYLSRTDYIGAKYFDSKIKDVMFHKQQDYKNLDVLGRCCQIVGVDKQLVIDNEEHTGGCQYLLKNIPIGFWEDVMKHCIELRLYTMDINRQYFLTEEKGLQSWAIGDMNGLLWNLWKRGMKTECPEVMDFCWASSPISRYDECSIFHNAGISGKVMEIDGKKQRMFNKADIRFRTSSVAFFDITDFGELSQDYCSYKYVEAIRNVNNPICMTSKYIY